MQHLKPGDLVSLHQDGEYYYYLILSPSAFFGCQWAYAFHLTSSTPLDQPTILATYGHGFHALIDFIDTRRENQVTKIARKIPITPYQNMSDLKARIEQPNGDDLWYIYSHTFSILAKQKSLDKSQYDFPIGSGMPSKKSINLIRKRFRLQDSAFYKGPGQFPF